MNWLISFLGGVPTSVHAALSEKQGETLSRVQAIEGTLSEAESNFASLKDVLEETRKDLLYAKEQSVDVAKRLSAAVQRAAQDLSAAKAEAAKDFETLKVENAKEVAVVVAERKLASDFRRTAELEAASLRKTVASVAQERDVYLKELNALRIDMENLRNTLVEAQSSGVYAQQRYDDTVTILEALRAENAELKAAAEAAAVTTSVPSKAEKRRR